MTIKTTDNNGSIMLINLKRKWQLTYCVRSFKVYIDDCQVGRIKPGRTETYEVSPGEHTIEIRIDWFKSEPFKVSSLTDQTLYLRCGVNALATLNFKLDTWLIVEPILSSHKSQISPVLLDLSIGILYVVLILLLVAGFVFYTWTTLVAIIVIFFSLVIQLLSKNYSFRITSNGMAPTLLKGDGVLAPKKSFEPQRGEIIFFEFTSVRNNHTSSAISRIIGLPGEDFEIKNGLVFINGEILNEGYIDELASNDVRAVMIPANHYFVLGDNRNGCRYDSRTVGFIPKEKIKARVTQITLPFKRCCKIPQVNYHQ